MWRIRGMVWFGVFVSRVKRVVCLPLNRRRSPRMRRVETRGRGVLSREGQSGRKIFSAHVQVVHICFATAAFVHIHLVCVRLSAWWRSLSHYFERYVHSLTHIPSSKMIILRNFACHLRPSVSSSLAFCNSPHTGAVALCHRLLPRRDYISLIAFIYKL